MSYMLRGIASRPLLRLVAPSLIGIIAYWAHEVQVTHNARKEVIDECEPLFSSANSSNERLCPYREMRFRP